MQFPIEIQPGTPLIENVAAKITRTNRQIKKILPVYENTDALKRESRFLRENPALKKSKDKEQKSGDQQKPIIDIYV